MGGYLDVVVCALLGNEINSVRRSTRTPRKDVPPMEAKVDVFGAVVQYIGSYRHVRQIENKQPD